MIRCSRWTHHETEIGTLSTTLCRQDSRSYHARVIGYPDGRHFGYVWSPRGIVATAHGPSMRRTAIRLLSALRRAGKG